MRDDRAFLRYARILLLSVPFVSLAVLNGLIFPFVTSKALLFFLVIELACLMLVLDLRARVTLSIGPIAALLSGFVLVLAIATFASGDIYRNFWSDVERMGGLYLWLHLLAFFIAARISFDDRAWRTFFISVFIAGSIAVFFAIAQKNGSIPLANGEGRVDALFGNPVFLASVLLFSMGFGLLAFVRSRVSYQRFVIGFALALHVLVLLYTGTRGSLLAFLGAIGVGCIVYASTPSASHRMQYACVGTVVATCAAVGALVAFNDHPLIASHPMLMRFNVLSLERMHDQARYYIWEASLDGIAEHPVVGNGLEEFGDVFNTHVEPRYFGKDHLTSLPEPWTDRAHNVFLDVGVGAGMPALVLFVLIGVYAAYVLLVTTAVRDLERSILLATLAAFVGHGLFSFSVLTDLVPLIALVAYADHADARRYVRTLELSRAHRVFFMVLVASLAVLAIACTANRAMFALEARTVLTRAQDDPMLEFIGYAELSERTFIDRRYLRSELPYVGMRALAEGSVREDDLPVLLAHVRDADDSLRRAGAPSIKDLYFFGAFYRTAGAYADARTSLEEARYRAPRYQLLSLELGRVAITERRYDEAALYLKTAYELEPNMEEVVVLYASVLMKQGRVEEADAVAKRYFGSGATARAMLSTQSSDELP